VRDRSEIRGVGLDQKAIAGDETKELVVCPFLERDDAAEGDVPSDGQRRLRQCVGAGEAMQYPAHAVRASFEDHGGGIVFSLAGVDDDGAIDPFGECQLGGENSALNVARRVIVVIVQSAFTDGNGATIDEIGDRLFVGWGPFRGVVWMDARRKCDEARIRTGQLLGVCRLRDRGADAHECTGACLCRALNYRVAVVGEGRVCEVAVAVDELFHAVARGYLRSIQRSTGPAM